MQPIDQYKSHLNFKNMRVMHDFKNTSLALKWHQKFVLPYVLTKLWRVMCTLFSLRKTHRKLIALLKLLGKIVIQIFGSNQKKVVSKETQIMLTHKWFTIVVRLWDRAKTIQNIVACISLHFTDWQGALESKGFKRLRVTSIRQKPWSVLKWMSHW